MINGVKLFEACVCRMRRWKLFVQWVHASDLGYYITVTVSGRRSTLAFIPARKMVNVFGLIDSHSMGPILSVTNWYHKNVRRLLCSQRVSCPACLNDDEATPTTAAEEIFNV